MSPTIQQAKHMFGGIISKSNVNYYYFPHFLTARTPCGSILIFNLLSSCFKFWPLLWRDFLTFFQILLYLTLINVIEKKDSCIYECFFHSIRTIFLSSYRPVTLHYYIFLWNFLVPSFFKTRLLLADWKK